MFAIGIGLIAAAIWLHGVFTGLETEGGSINPQ